MLLVKNKLKKKRTIDDDEYLNYLKFSHLDSHLYTSKRTHINKENDASPEARELRDIELNNNLEIANIEPKKVHTANKGVDTGNDFVEVIPPYASFMHSEDFDRNEKMVQVWTKMFKQNLTPPPSSSSSSNGSEGFLPKTARMGFRLAEFALNTAIVGANVTTAVTDTIADLVFAPHQSSEEEAVNNPEIISVNSSPPETINSSSSGVEVVPPIVEISSSSSSRQAPSSIPAPTSPQPSSPASSAKTTPRKKSK